MSAAGPSQEIVSVNLGPRSYDIVVEPGCVQRASDLVSQWCQQRGWGQSRTALIVTDTNVRQHADRVRQQLMLAGWRIAQFEMEPGEASKRQEVINAIYDSLVELRADRKTLLIAVGGGVVGDAAGFAAASFVRGLPFIQIPTTLLADVDSSVGGKVGINHPQAKNLIGAFHQPLGVLIDPELLQTLPEREYRSGLAEVVKYGVILDAEFFNWLEQNCSGINERRPADLRSAIARSCRLKADVVEQDEYERTGLRAALNYGHTFAHAFEALTGYGALLHGEAVAVGMICASRLAEKLGRINADVTQRQVELLQRYQLPDRLPKSPALTTEAILDRMQLDKKTEAGQLRFVLPSRMGAVALVDHVPLPLVEEVLADLLAG